MTTETPQLSPADNVAKQAEAVSARATQLVHTGRSLSWRNAGTLPRAKALLQTRSAELRTDLDRLDAALSAWPL